MTSTPNPYQALHGEIDLSGATFNPIKLDEIALAAAVEQINKITSSNLEQRAQWNAILTTIDGVLRTAGMVTRLVAVT